MSIPIDIARKVLEASKQRAKELRSPVSIAIVDAGGHLVLFERMMAPYGWATGNISIAKASTAVMFNQPTDSVAQWGSGIPGFASSMATMTQGKFIMAAGGWPIRMGGATIGGIGVSGGNAPGRDDEIARAGLAVLENLTPALPGPNLQAQQEAAAPPVPAVPSPPPFQGPMGSVPPIALPPNSIHTASPTPTARASAGPYEGQQNSTHYLNLDSDDPYKDPSYNPDRSGGQ